MLGTDALMAVLGRNHSMSWDGHTYFTVIDHMRRMTGYC